jgi:signal transduction histidine kinase
MDLSKYTDMKQLEKAIVRRIYITLYKKSRDARDKINQEWFDLNEILNSAFRDNERELVAKFMPRFKDVYSANNLLIDKDSVKLTQEGREMIKFYFLSR